MNQSNSKNFLITLMLSLIVFLSFVVLEHWGPETSDSTLKVPKSKAPMQATTKKALAKIAPQDTKDQCILSVRFSRTKPTDLEHTTVQCSSSNKNSMPWYETLWAYIVLGLSTAIGFLSSVWSMIPDWVLSMLKILGLGAIFVILSGAFST